MSQESLRGLIMISIKNEVLAKLKYKIKLQILYRRINFKF